jgi:hypothetical protein
LERNERGTGGLIMIDITPIINALILLVGTIITIFVVPYLKQKFDNGKLAEIEEWVEIAVTAAEQYFGSSHGREKKEFVVEFLRNKGFKIDLDSLDKMIEYTVYKLFGKDKEIE